MKAISIRQPWAGAVVLGYKPVENRSRMFSHRGQVLIHAGLFLAHDYAAAADLIEDQAGVDVDPMFALRGVSPAWELGAFVGVTDLYDAHRGCDGSCSPWAFPGQVHHMLRDARPLLRPVRAAGRLGSWEPDADILDRVRAVWPR